MISKVFLFHLCFLLISFKFSSTFLSSSLQWRFERKNLTYMNPIAELAYDHVGQMTHACDFWKKKYLHVFSIETYDEFCFQTLGKLLYHQLDPCEKYLSFHHCLNLTPIKMKVYVFWIMVKKHWIYEEEKICAQKIYEEERLESVYKSRN